MRSIFPTGWWGWCSAVHGTPHEHEQVGRVSKRRTIGQGGANRDMSVVAVAPVARGGAEPGNPGTCLSLAPTWCGWREAGTLQTLHIQGEHVPVPRVNRHPRMCHHAHQCNLQAHEEHHGHLFDLPSATQGSAHIIPESPPSDTLERWGCDVNTAACVHRAHDHDAAHSVGTRHGCQNMHAAVLRVVSWAAHAANAHFPALLRCSGGQQHGCTPRAGTARCTVSPPLVAWWQWRAAHTLGRQVDIQKYTAVPRSNQNKDMLWSEVGLRSVQRRGGGRGGVLANGTPGPGQSLLEKASTRQTRNSDQVGRPIRQTQQWNSSGSESRRRNFAPSQRAQIVTLRIRVVTKTHHQTAKERQRIHMKWIQHGRRAGQIISSNPPRMIPGMSSHAQSGGGTALCLPRARRRTRCTRHTATLRLPGGMPCEAGAKLPESDVVPSALSARRTIPEPLSGNLRTAGSSIGNWDFQDNAQQNGKYINWLELAISKQASLPPAAMYVHCNTAHPRMLCTGVPTGARGNGSGRGPDMARRGRGRVSQCIKLGDQQRSEFRGVALHTAAAHGEARRAPQRIDQVGMAGFGWDFFRQEWRGLVLFPWGELEQPDAGHFLHIGRRALFEWVAQRAVCLALPSAAVCQRLGFCKVAQHMWPFPDLYRAACVPGSSTEASSQGRTSMGVTKRRARVHCTTEQTEHRCNRFTQSDTSASTAPGSNPRAFRWEAMVTTADTSGSADASACTTDERKQRGG
eukprot:gene2690-biopygen15621